MKNNKITKSEHLKNSFIKWLTFINQIKETYYYD